MASDWATEFAKRYWQDDTSGILAERLAAMLDEELGNVIAARKIVDSARAVNSAIENGEILSSDSAEHMQLLNDLAEYDKITPATEAI